MHSFYPTETTIFVRGLAVRAQVGIAAPERNANQTIILDLAIRLKDPVIRVDRMAASVNYKTVVEMIEKLCETERMLLIETLAERIAEGIFVDARVGEVAISVTKPRKLPHADAVGVTRTFRAKELSSHA